MDYPINWISKPRKNKLDPALRKHGNITGLHPIYISEINATIFIKNPKNEEQVRKRYLKSCKLSWK